MNCVTTYGRGAATRLIVAAVAAIGSLLGAAQAAVPGITTTAAGTAATFNLTASEGRISQPDGAMIYSWGYGCSSGSTPAFAPLVWTGGTAPSCGLFQVPAPTLIVTEGQTVTVNLTNSLPAVAGNTSIVFTGFPVTASNGVPGLVTREAAPGATVTYRFVATRPGTYAYYSGTQPELQIEMGMYGAVVVIPSGTGETAAGCTALGATKANGQPDYRLAVSAYDHPQTCYDREYLFQFTELDIRIHQAAEAQAQACAALQSATPAGTTPPACAPLQVKTEPYVPQYYLINGRSMPDLMDANYSPNYPSQPYNGNPHIHPGEMLLMRVIGQGRIQHPFHIHGDHERTLARDGNLLLAQTDPAPLLNAAGARLNRLAGPLLFTVPTVSGQSLEGLFAWSGKGLNWDVYGHKPNDNPAVPCVPDANGYYTVNSNPPAPPTAPNYGEWCADHNKPIPLTPADPQIVANGLWYAGTPYLGVQTNNSAYTSTPLPPGTALQNTSAGYAYMWHSHDEREITTNDVFPGGMMMMLIIDPPAAAIDETQ